MAELEKMIWISIILIAIISVKDKIKLALPILLVSAGLLLSLTRLVPSIEMSPEMIFYLVLPPILFDAAWNTSIPDFRKELPKISVLAVGLVFLTTTIIAFAVHSIIPGFSWPMAFVLGAIVSPPDAVAATSITKNLPIPQKLTTILEGESLLNDASALIAYKCAVAAVLSGIFSFRDAGFQFVTASLGGIMTGLLIGFVFLKLHRYFIGHSSAETFAVVLLPFAVYSLAEHLHCSGVLAVVTLGMFLSWNSFSIFSADSRLQMGHFWDVVIFVLNGVVFLILGMQLPEIISDIPVSGLPVLILYGFLIFVILVVIRLIVLAVFPVFSEKSREMEAGFLSQPKKEYLILSWSGMRGVVSLAAALALPLYDDQGTAIEQRSTLLFITFVVILFTLLIQGISLPKLISMIQPAAQDEQDEETLNLLLLEKSVSFLKDCKADGNLALQAIEKMTEKLEKEKHDIFQKEKSQSVTDQILFRKMYYDLELQLSDHQRKELVKSYHHGDFSLEVIRKKEGELDFWTATVRHEIEALEKTMTSPDQ
ncbi:MAG: Na+/H+ antiporter [Chryseobacterium sp.]|jgi:CPA1 family monovalent cation:H+ antiporter|uniref:Na+/H+ antiporter n=1 Tax=Chryseobacterium sp. TaxID=1871047 RepID=UPI00282633A5|nr:Na+/H+ antiporter [Chryseobacterium sp.]MDR2235033.1 Na+/H+ antiporter [Chryseobacterium sp.]